MSLKQCLFNSSVFLVLALGLSSCSDNDEGTKVVTPWEVQAPYFKVFDNQTDQASKSPALNRIDLDTANLKIATTDQLIFEDADQFPGSTLSAITTCSGDKDRIFKQSSRISLFKENSVYRFLPEALLLMPTDQLSKFKCSVHFIAQTPNGSTHDFGDKVHFTLNAENRELLAKLEDEAEVEVQGIYSNLALITLQRARYFYLPYKETASTYRLKCSDFESSSSSANQLLQLIETNPQTENIKTDQFCRLFIQDQNGITKATKLFSLRFFDTKNYTETIEQKSYGTSHRTKTMFKIEHIVLHNRTKYPIFFSVTDFDMIAIMSIKNHNIESPARATLGFSIDGNQHHDHIRRLPNKTIFVLLPGQKVIPSLDITARGVSGHVTMVWRERMPTLDILDKKSWEDPNENILTSLPMMSGPSAYAYVKQIIGDGY
jgi:hypothetical protein